MDREQTARERRRRQEAGASEGIREGRGGAAEVPGSRAMMALHSTAERPSAGGGVVGKNIAVAVELLREVHEAAAAAAAAGPYIGRRGFSSSRQQENE